MKYVIRKVPERDTTYLERLIPEALVFCDTEHRGCRWSFEQAILMADDDAVYIQDDMILCKGFKEKVAEAVKKHPAHCIVFATTHYNKDSKKAVKTGFWTPEEALWLMCTYIPKEMGQAFLKAKRYNMFKVHKNAIRFDFDDVEFSDFLTSMGEKVFAVIPNLAGHPRNKSATGFSRSARICKYFDYENAEV